MDKIKENIAKIVEKEGGKWQGIEWRDKRKMAYKIKGQTRGIYIARRFEIPEKDAEEYGSETIQGISKQMKLNSDILRFIITKADELPELKNGPEAPREKAARPKERRPELKKPEKKRTEEKAADGKKAKSIDEKLEEILNI